MGERLAEVRKEALVWTSRGTYRRAMIKREALIFTVCLAIATALTLAGTYYAVSWVSPPITQTMPHNR